METINQEVVLPTESDSPSQYFSVSLPKFILMSVCTFGLYELYWHYKNWAYINQRDNLNIMPFWRAFFAPFWAFSLFKNIRNDLEPINISFSLPAGIMAFIYFILQALWRLPDPYWLVSYVSFIPLLPANIAATKINEKVQPNFQQNYKIQGWNWVAVVLGGLLFIFAVVGAFLPPTA